MVYKNDSSKASLWKLCNFLKEKCWFYNSNTGTGYHTYEPTFFRVLNQPKTIPKLPRIPGNPTHYLSNFT